MAVILSSWAAVARDEVAAETLRHTMKSKGFVAWRYVQTVRTRTANVIARHSSRWTSLRLRAVLDAWLLHVGQRARAERLVHRYFSRQVKACFQHWALFVELNQSERFLVRQRTEQDAALEGRVTKLVSTLNSEQELRLTLEQESTALSGQLGRIRLCARGMRAWLLAVEAVRAACHAAETSFTALKAAWYADAFRMWASVVQAQRRHSAVIAQRSRRRELTLLSRCLGMWRRELTVQVEDLRQRLTDQQKDFAVRAEELVTERNDLARENGQLLSALDTAKASLAESRTSLARLQEEGIDPDDRRVLIWRDKVHTLESQLDVAIAELKESENTSLQNVGELRAQNDEARAEIIELQSALEAANERAGRLERERDTARLQLETALLKAREAEERAKAQAAEDAELYAELLNPAALEDELNEVREEAAERARAVTRLEDQVESLKQQKELLQNTLMSEGATLRALEKENDDLRAALPHGLDKENLAKMLTMLRSLLAEQLSRPGSASRPAPVRQPLMPTGAPSQQQVMPDMVASEANHAHAEDAANLRANMLRQTRSLLDLLSSQASSMLG